MFRKHLGGEIEASESKPEVAIEASKSKPEVAIEASKS
jgi:hypothetical protein